MLLLPGAKQASSDTPIIPAAAAGQGTGKTKPAAKATLSTRLGWQQHMGSAKMRKADGAKKAQPTVDPECLTWPYADLQTGHEVPGTNTFRTNFLCHNVC